MEKGGWNSWLCHEALKLGKPVSRPFTIEKAYFARIYVDAGRFTAELFCLIWQNRLNDLCTVYSLNVEEGFSRGGGIDEVS